MRQRWVLVLAGGFLPLVFILVLVSRSGVAETRPRAYVPVRDVARELPAEAKDWRDQHCQGITRASWHRVERSDDMVQEESIDPKALATCELYVVRVLEVHDQGATFKRPPRVALTVEQVILGEPQTQPLPAVFSASLGDHFCGNGAMEEAQQRAQEPAPGPALGERFIVAGGWNQARTWFEVTSSNRWPVTDTRLADLTTALKTAREKEPDFDARIEKRRKEDVAAQTDPDLLRAVDQGDRARVQAMLEGGARPNTSADGDFSALQKAVKRKDAPMVALLMRHMPRDTQDPEALRLALTDLELVRTLLEGGLSWRGRERSNGPMNDAASMGACEALTLLLKAGGDPNTVGQDRQTVLHAATRSTRGLRCVPLLLEAGATAEVSSGGWTPLIYAAYEKYSPEAELAIRALVAHGARVDRKTPEGEGLLEAARKSPEMVTLLQSLGAR
ncbi:ankyrin repeat domain-containing protein [Corallococcus sp. BB11-1]|uniref:ankyrin repeat domain-containing protein n=1 Tax=Corallococcus sp. BB11-1 TaxID=2996783 RepID=UPI0010E00C0A|nr:ankyrin repeat domain-containing protein [Corallococcus sp. BB11-1]MCY1030989.1 ankyrin repeat domain-containing protein [Corallococcus sp. BB11-1]RYZ17506.1 MAG: hypothetical protein EOO70_01730 [Myxococcaceae bacterium]